MAQLDQKHIDALTSLRFFAAFYVLIFHSGGPALVASGLMPQPVVNFLANGYLGVTFFFVLSGFILTYVYFGRLDAQGATGRYLRARFARVYPVYLLSLLLMIPFVPDTGLWHVLPTVRAAAILDPAQFVRRHLHSRTGTCRPGRSRSNYCSTCCFPFALLFIQSWNRMALMIGALSCAALMLAFRLPEIRGPQNLLFPWLLEVPFPLLRVPEFLYGVVLGALYCRGHAPVAPRVLYGCGIATVLVLFASSSPWVAPIVAILVGVIVLLVPTSLQDGPLKLLLEHRWMVLLGGASYAVYVLQLPVHHIVQSVFTGAYATIGKFAYFPILIGFSVLVFKFYEEPLRYLLKTAPRPRTAPAE